MADNNQTKRFRLPEKVKVRVAVIQSNFVPWRGYFDFIRKVDLFLFYDDVQFTKNDWRNRNTIKTPQGVRWLTVPARRRSLHQRIDQTEIDYSGKWQKTHKGMLVQYYKTAAYYAELSREFFEIIDRDYQYLSELNQALIFWAMEKLEIRTPVKSSSEYLLQGSRGERLLDLLQQLGATHYLSGPSAKSYIDESLFQDRGISLEYQTYRYPTYPQLHGEFIGGVSILDLLFNCGPTSKDYFTFSDEVTTTDPPVA